MTVHRLESVPFDRLVEHSLDVIAVLDAAGQLRYVNPAVQRVLGYEATELVGRRLLALIHPDDEEEVARTLALRAGTPGVAPTVEWRFKHRDGGWRRLEVVSANLLGDPAVGAVVLNARDVTEWDEARHALRDSEERYRAYVAHSSDGIWRVELGPGVPTALPVDEQIVQWYRSARLAECNPALARMIGRDGATELIGARLTDLFPQEEPGSWHLLRAFAGNEYRVDDAESRRPGPGGVMRYYVNGLLGVVEHGALARIWGVRRDVTDQRAAAERLRRSEAWIRLVLDQVPAILWTTDTELNLTSSSGAGLEVLGRRSSDLVGSSIARLGAPEDENELLERHRAALRGSSFEFEIRLGRHRYGARLQPLRDAEGRVTGTIGVALDVTQQQEMEERLQHAQRLEAVGQLTAGIAHEFNNLLTAILTNADLAGGALEHGHAAARDLEAIGAAAQRGGTLVRKLLGFGRRDLITLRPVRVADIVQAFREAAAGLLPPSITVNAEAVDDALLVRADSAACKQILLNLASNARDAMPDGGTLTIEAVRLPGCAEVGAMVEIVVSDTGTGMGPGVLEHAFEPFFTTRPTGQGAGLGLAMVYGLVQQHGGTVALESAIGSGTVARIRLPASSPGVTGADDTVADATATEHPPGLGVILLAEDDAPIRDAARRLLEQRGYEVIEAADGIEALERFAAREPDIGLLICDVIMPRLGGRGVLDALRRKGKSVPFLFVSGQAGRGGVAADALEPGIPNLPKPWSAEELLSHVRFLLGTART